jgi:hypothetical protein
MSKHAAPNADVTLTTCPCMGNPRNVPMHNTPNADVTLATTVGAASTDVL